MACCVFHPDCLAPGFIPESELVAPNFSVTQSPFLDMKSPTVWHMEGRAAVAYEIELADRVRVVTVDASPSLESVLQEFKSRNCEFKHRDLNRAVLTNMATVTSHLQQTTLPCGWTIFWLHASPRCYPENEHAKFILGDCLLNEHIGSSWYGHVLLCRLKDGQLQPLEEPSMVDLFLAACGIRADLLKSE